MLSVVILVDDGLLSKDFSTGEGGKDKNNSFLSGLSAP